MKPIHDQSAEVLAAVQLFGNPLRVAVIRQLQDGTKFQNEIIEAVQASQVSVSHQLQTLREFGLTNEELVPGRGRPVRYTLNTQRYTELLTAFCDYIGGE
jgi:DNA-binding transcriptional ArsR family regulator